MDLRWCCFRPHFGNSQDQVEAVYVRRTYSRAVEQIEYLYRLSVVSRPFQPSSDLSYWYQQCFALPVALHGAHTHTHTHTQRERERCSCWKLNYFLWQTISLVGCWQSALSSGTIQPSLWSKQGNGVWSLRAVIARKSLRNAAGSGSGQRARMGASR